MNDKSKLDPKVLKSLEENKIQFEIFECDENFADTYVFCEKYGFSLSQSANTIVIASKSEPVKYAACVALATTKLDVNKKVCQMLEVKKASFASMEQTIQQTDMKIGGVTIFGIPNMPIYVDLKVFENGEIVMGGGNRSSKVVLAPKELRKLPNLEVIENLAIPKQS